MSVIVEIRSAEGGEDSRLLVREQATIYTKLAERRKLTLELIDVRSGSITLRVSGKGAEATFRNEPGGHRFQRIPPNEKRGRVHSSTITVAVLREPTAAEVVLRDDDLEISLCRGSGAGGQHRNMTDSAVQIKHKPTGLMVRCESERSQHQNRESAMSVLRARLLSAQEEANHTAYNNVRKQHVGAGMRGDKRRTVRFQEGIVTDHLLDVRVPLKEYLRGDFDALLKG
jgi:peptide chain release factor 1